MIIIFKLIKVPHPKQKQRTRNADNVREHCNVL
jgi:hypothetical protein